MDRQDNHNSRSLTVWRSASLSPCRRRHPVMIQHLGSLKLPSDPLRKGMASINRASFKMIQVLLITLDSSSHCLSVSSESPSWLHVTGQAAGEMVLMQGTRSTKTVFNSTHQGQLPPARGLPLASPSSRSVWSALY
jgi:hypothetical protein